MVSRWQDTAQVASVGNHIVVEYSLSSGDVGLNNLLVVSCLETQPFLLNMTYPL
jgi:hypothetical protein